MTPVAHGRCESCHAPNTPGWRVCPDCGHDRMQPRESTPWLVWFAYYSETATVGIVEADTPDDACEKFWSQNGDGDHWPVRGVHARPANPGRTIDIHAEH